VQRLIDIFKGMAKKISLKKRQKYHKYGCDRKGKRGYFIIQNRMVVAGIANNVVGLSVAWLYYISNGGG